MRADRPVVSVKMRCFNHLRYLDDSFRGLVAQTCEDVELLDAGLPQSPEPTRR